jgi:hypothetical protein
VITNLVNEEAITRVGLQSQKKKTVIVEHWGFTTPEKFEEF